MHNVFICHGTQDIIKMFKERGWEVTREIKKADLIVFTGGADISPQLYHSKKHNLTITFPTRDKKELLLLGHALRKEIPIVGICRGAQLINVALRGSMYQHVDGHREGKLHKVRDLWTDKEFMASSSHHQMMIPHKSAEVLAVANVTRRRERYNEKGHYVFESAGKIWQDPETVIYFDNNALCFQPHPEYSSDKETSRPWFFHYIENLILDS